MIVDVTPGQRRVFEALMDRLMTDGIAPRVRDLCGEATGIGSSNGVAEHLDRLRVRGLITKDARKTRGIEITDRGWSLWAEILSERSGREIGPVEARIATRLWRDVKAVGVGKSVEGLRSFLAHLGAN